VVDRHRKSREAKGVIFKPQEALVAQNPSNSDTPRLDMARLGTSSPNASPVATPKPKHGLAEHAKYGVGQLIHHTVFDYRGVIVDVDPQFRIGAGMKAPERRPQYLPEDSMPWYHVLVDGTANRAYVSEQNLEPDVEGSPIDHPDVIDYFNAHTAGGYTSHPHKVH